MKKVKVLEFENISHECTQSLFYELQLSPESHAMGGITLHADGRLVIALADVDADKVEIIKQKLGEPKKIEEKKITSLPLPPPPIAELELNEIVSSKDIECPFCHAKLKLKPSTKVRSMMEGVEILNGVTQG